MKKKQSNGKKDSEELIKMKAIQVTRYETEDGRIFDTEEEAAAHEKGLSAGGILKSLDDEAIKKMEIPLKGKTPNLIPLSYFLDELDNEDGKTYYYVNRKKKQSNGRKNK